MFDISVAENCVVELPNQKFLDHLQNIFTNILEEFNKKNRECSIILCDDSFIQELNKEYRNKDTSTDVLSFAMDDDDEFPAFEFSSLGDIIISIDHAKKQAQEFDVSYEEEFARLAIHGLLHLLGFDHELSEEDHKIMFEYQDKFMDDFMQSYNGTNSQKI